MTITAKYAGTCPQCCGAIQPGAAIEWKKGAKARHAGCAPTPKKRSGPNKCFVCGRPGSGECQDCIEERRMGY